MTFYFKRPSKNRGLKSIAVIVLSVFSLNSALQAEGSAVLSLSHTKAMESLRGVERIFAAGLPVGSGKVQRVFRADNKSKKMIIHIQDAHLNEEAQRNISSIVRYFVKSHHAKLIALEGASGELSHHLLSGYPGAEARELMADYFLKEGMLSGPEYEVISRCPECVLFGVEDRELYEKNRKAYLNALDFQDADQKILHDLEKILNGLARSVFPQDFLKILDLKDSLNNPSGDFLPYLQALHGFCQTYHVEGHYPSAEALLELIEREKKRGESGSELREKDLPALREKVKAGIFDEMQEMALKLEKQILKTADQKMLAQFFHILEIDKGLFDFSLTAENATDFYGMRDSFRHEIWKDKLTPLLRKYGYEKLFAQLDLAKIDSDLPKVEAFYELALRRDQVLMGHMLEEMSERHETLALLITGGFHTPGMEKILRSKGVSYMVITPEISKESVTSTKNQYIQAMRSEETPLMSVMRNAFYSSKPTLINDPSYQLQPPRRLPSIDEVFMASGQLGSISPLEMAVQFPATGFLIQEMMTTDLQDVRLGSGNHGKDFLVSLSPDEKKLAQIYYGFVYGNKTKREKRLIFGSRKQGMNLGSAPKSDARFSEGAEWQPVSARPEIWNAAEKIVGFKTRDNVIMKVRVMTDPDDYALARLRLLARKNAAEKNTEKQFRTRRSELRAAPEFSFIMQHLPDFELEENDYEILQAVLDRDDVRDAMIKPVRNAYAAEGLPKNIDIRMRAHSVLEDETKVPRPSEDQIEKKRSYKLMIETPEGRKNFNIYIEDKEYDADGKLVNYHWSLRIYTEEMNELDHMLRSARDADGNPVGMQALLGVPVPPYATLHVDRLNLEENAGLKIYSIGVEKKEKDLRFAFKPSTAAKPEEPIKNENGKLYVAQWKSQPYSLGVYPKEPQLSPVPEKKQLALSRPGQADAVVQKPVVLETRPAVTQTKETVAETPQKETTKILEEASKDPEAFVEKGGIEEVMKHYREEKEDRSVLEKKNAIEEDLRELLQRAQENPEASYEMDLEKTVRLFGEYQKLHAEEEQVARAELRKAAGPGPGLDVVTLFSAAAVFGFSPQTFGVWFVAAFFFRFGLTLSMLVHEWSHLTAAVRFDGEKIFTWKNFLGNEPVKKWLFTLVPFLPWMQSARVQLSKQISLEGLVRHAGWMSSGILAGVAAVAAYFLMPSIYALPVLAAGTGAILILIRGFISDIFFPQPDGTYCCGNAGALVKRKAWEDGILPYRMESFLEGMGRITKVRGEQAAGRVVFVRNGKSIGVARERVVNPKRADLAVTLRQAFRKRYQGGWFFNTFKAAQDVYLAMEHYRYGTSSAPAVEETHPHQWMRERMVLVWEIRDGKPVPVKRRLANLVTHNGDFDLWNIFGKNHPFDHIGLWLERVLHTPNNTKGDSPKVAGMMDLLLTQGMWDASVRLAYQLEVSSSLQDAFGGQEPSKDAPNTAPSVERIRGLANLFEKAFAASVEAGGLSGITSLAEVSQAKRKKLERKILQTLEQDSEMKKWPDAKKELFVSSAVQAFFENDLYGATRMFMSRAVGSFGLVTVSTLFPDKFVLSARGQPISIGFHPQEKMVAYASEAAALKVPFGKSQTKIPYRLDLDQVGGEIAEVSLESVKIYSEKKHRELSEEELSYSGRLIEMEDNPYMTPLPPEDGKDPVGKDIRDIPRIFSSIREDWKEPESFNRQTAADLFNLLVKRMQRQETGVATDALDLVITGIETSQWVGEQFMEDLRKLFPSLNILSISSNKILESARKGKIPNTDKNTLFFNISQSGQTFPTLNASILLERMFKGRVFVMTGDIDTLMGAAVGQRYYKGAPFSRRIFTNGSGRRTAEPSTVAAAAAHQTLTELLLFFAQQMEKSFPARKPFQMGLKNQETEELLQLRDRLVDQGVVSITGVTARGDKVDSRENKKLMGLGKKWSQHVLEPAIVWGLSAFYIAVTVIFGIPLFTSLAQLLLAAFDVSADFGIFVYAAHIADALFYIFLPFVFAVGLRFLQGRTLFARLGKRTLVIGDIPYVHQFLESYASKLFSMSYAIASLDVHGASPGDHMLHRFGHRVVRGTLMLLGRPDGRLREQKDKEPSVLMTGKQAKGVRNHGVGAEIFTIGHNPSKNPNALDDAVDLWQHTAPKTPGAQKFYDGRFASLERLIAGYVLLHAMADRVSSFWPLRYDKSRSQSGTRVASTASPVSGADLFSRNGEPEEPELRLEKPATLPFKVVTSVTQKPADERAENFSHRNGESNNEDAFTQLFKLQIKGLETALRRRFDTLENKIKLHEEINHSEELSSIEEWKLEQLKKLSRIGFPPILYVEAKRVLNVVENERLAFIQKIIAEEPRRNGHSPDLAPLLFEVPRSELRAPQSDLVEGLREKTRIERELRLKKLKILSDIADEALKNNLNFEAMLSRFSGKDLPGIHFPDAVLAEQGELILNYKAGEHDANFIKRFFQQVARQPRGFQFYIFKDPGTRDDEWRELKKLAPPGAVVQFVDGHRFTSFEKFVQYRSKMLRIERQEIVQFIDEEGIVRQNQQRWFQAALLGAVPLARKTLVVLGFDSPLFEVRRVSILDLVQASFQSTKAVLQSA